MTSFDDETLLEDTVGDASAEDSEFNGFSEENNILDSSQNGDTKERSLRKALTGALGRVADKLGYDRREKTFQIWKFKVKRRTMIILLVIIAVILLFMSCTANGKKKMLEAMQPKDITVEIRSIEKKVTGSSVIQPKDSYSIMTITTGEIIKDFISEGDTVEKGDNLYQFDSETPQNSVDSAQNALKRAQQNYADAVKAKSLASKTNNASVKSAQLAVERAQQGYNDAVKTTSNLSVKADVGGGVGEVYAAVGDMVGSGQKLADVYDDTYLKIQIPFNELDADNIYTGDAAVLTVVNSGEEIIGTVTEVNSASISTAEHNIVKYVTIELANPGALTNSDMATAQVGGIACNGAGQFEYKTQRSVCAEASGKVTKMYISKNSSVSSGQVIAELESDSVKSGENSAKLSLDDAVLALERAVLQSDEYSQDSAVINARLALDDARLALEKAQKGLNDYTITAPISGTVVTKNSKAGDKIDSSNATTPMCIIYDMSSMQFDISVDEIDVANVKVGQEVTVKADAIPDKTFKGVVEKVSVNGVSEKGVTNYPITVKIDDYGDLLPGMNVDAEIVVEKVEDALAVPVSSLQRGDIVYVKGEKENKEDKAPEGYRSVEVVTGISDDDYIEIKSGLNNGDIVRGQENDLTSDLEKMMMQQMGGGPNGGPDRH